MKKNILKGALLSGMLMMVSSVNAQVDLKSIAEGVLSSANSSQSTSASSGSNSGGLIQSLTAIFSSNKQANENNHWHMGI